MSRTDLIRFELVLFDLDGTLFRSEADIVNAWKETMSCLGLDCPRFASLFRVGPSLEEMTGTLFPGIDGERKQEIIREFKRRYDSSTFPATVPYEWAGAMLTALKSAGRKLAVVTNKRQDPTRVLLKKSGWEAQFDGSFSPDILPGTSMTKPELAGDIAPARRNPDAPAADTRGYGSQEELKKAEPDLLLTPATWRELLQ